jgi:hypothetical protein
MGKRQPHGFQVTDRDLEIVRWLGRVKLGTVDHVRTRMGMGRTKAYDRLAALVTQGLLIHVRPVPGHGVYLASRKGLAVAGLELAPGSVSLAALSHDLAVAGLVAELEGLYPGLALQTEREIRAHIHHTGDATFRPMVRRRGMRDARHWPDLALLTGSADEPGWLAIEVELTRKGSERLRAILAGYRNTHHLSDGARTLWGVLYLVPGQVDAERVMALGVEEQLGSDSYPVTLLAHRLDEQDAAASALRSILAAHDAARDAHRHQSRAAAARRTAAQAQRVADQQEWAARAETAQASIRLAEVRREQGVRRRGFRNEKTR